jgi:Zn-dependent M28 family amino/carboxypeptidase
MPGRSCRFDLSDVSEQERQIEANLRAHVDQLAVHIGERHKGIPDKLALAREYITKQLSSGGRRVVEQHCFADGINLTAGTGDIIIGAHYDTIPGSPGANDNATGIAVMLELARLLDSPRFRFVAFDNEEHVGQPATQMGSYCYAMDCAARGEKLAGMWSLETVGCFSQEPHSQRYPEPFDLFYPTVGNFVAFVGNDASSDWVRRCVGAFRSLRGFPCEGVAAPGKFADVNRSDQWGFWQAGYPGLMVTDTANFRSAAYHTPADTPEKINFPAMARLANVLHETARKVI